MSHAPRRRCCEPIADEFAPSYASVLSYGDGDGLRRAVEALENDEPLTSCFTAWCPRCRGTYLLASDADTFPSVSAHHTHKLRLLALLQETGIFAPPAAGHKSGASDSI